MKHEAMKRLPLYLTVLAVVLLSASLAYWGLELFKPKQRAISAPPPAMVMQLNIEAAKGLFGGQTAVAVVSNYQLKGVVAALGGENADSAAILSVDNQPALALAIGREVVPGVVVKEVHPKYVLLSEGGVIKRIDLASDAGVSSSAPMPSGATMPANAVPAQQQQQQQSRGGPQPRRQVGPQQPMQQLPPTQPVQPAQPAPQEQAPPTPTPPQAGPQRSSVSTTTTAPAPGADRQQ